MSCTSVLLSFWQLPVCTASQHQFCWGIPHGPGVRDVSLGSIPRASTPILFSSFALGDQWFQQNFDGDKRRCWLLIRLFCSSPPLVLRGLRKLEIAPLPAVPLR